MKRIACCLLLVLSSAPVFASDYEDCKTENSTLTTCSNSWYNAISRCCREKNDKCRTAATSIAERIACTDAMLSCTNSLTIFYSTNCPASVPSSIEPSNDKAASPYLCIGGRNLHLFEVEVPATQ